MRSLISILGQLLAEWLTNAARNTTQLIASEKFELAHDSHTTNTHMIWVQLFAQKYQALTLFVINILNNNINEFDWGRGFTQV